MSFDVSQLPKIKFASKTDKQSIGMPEWIRFCIWAGGEMRVLESGSRQVMVLLLPDRYGCSAFCAFGAMLKGSTIPSSLISWSDFISLNLNEKVFLLIKYGNKYKPVIGTIFSDNADVGGGAKKLKIESSHKSLNGSFITITRNNFKNYQISLKSHASSVALSKANKISKFYEDVVEELQTDWMVGDRIESVVITNKSEWERQAQEIIINEDGKNGDIESEDTSLYKILCTTNDEEHQTSHTRIVSDTAFESIKNSPLVIVDGAKALRGYEGFLENNVIILLSQSEYTEEEEGILAKLSSFREDKLVRNMRERLEKIIPHGIDISIFAFYRNNHDE